MPAKFFQALMILSAIGFVSTALPTDAHAASTAQIESYGSTIESHFSPRPSTAMRLDFEAWDFILSETVLYMGPSTRKRKSTGSSQFGTRLASSHTSPYKMEGNKILYSLMTDDVKSEIKAYADELIALGNRLDIPSLPRNEQLAYWINLHNAVLIATISENYPGPSRRPTLIEPLSGSDAKLHEAKLIHIDDYALSLRDVREKIVFPYWKNKDVPYAFHLGYLGSPSMANVAYSGPKLQNQLKVNAEEFVNSMRGYRIGKLNPYIRDISQWYYPDLNQDLDRHLRQRMRGEIYTEFKSSQLKFSAREDLTIADMTGGFGKKGGVEKYYNNAQSTRYSTGLGREIDIFLQDRAKKFLQLKKLEWFRESIVTIEDTPTTDGGEPLVIE